MASDASRFVANSPKPPTDAARGIAAADLNESRKEMPRVPIESYTAEMPPDVARTWVDEFKEAGPDPIRFAWSVPADRNQPHAYRVRGLTFLIAFNNHPEQRQAHPQRVAERAERHRRPAGVTLS